VQRYKKTRYLARVLGGCGAGSWVWWRKVPGLVAQGPRPSGASPPIIRSWSQGQVAQVPPSSGAGSKIMQVPAPGKRALTRLYGHIAGAGSGNIFKSAPVIPGTCSGHPGNLLRSSWEPAPVTSEAGAGCVKACSGHIKGWRRLCQSLRRLSQDRRRLSQNLRRSGKEPAPGSYF